MLTFHDVVDSFIVSTIYCYFILLLLSWVTRWCSVVRALACFVRGPEFKSRSNLRHLSHVPPVYLAVIGYLKPSFVGTQLVQKGTGHPTTTLKPWAHDDHLRVIPQRDGYLTRLSLPLPNYYHIRLIFFLNLAQIQIVSLL